jgi:hypothetical protein
VPKGKGRPPAGNPEVFSGKLKTGYFNYDKVIFPEKTSVFPAHHKGK